MADDATPDGAVDGRSEEDEPVSAGGFIATGPCVACDVVFSFNATRVPSFEGKPICRPCVEQVNELRAEEGIAPVVIYDDSYSIERP